MFVDDHLKGITFVLIWSWITFLAIVGVLFVVFYGINAEQERGKQTAANMATTADTATASSDKAAPASSTSAPGSGEQPAAADATTGQAAPRAAPPAGEDSKPNK